MGEPANAMMSGGQAIGDVLARLPSSWTIFHDLRWPGRARATIGHLVIGPAGIFIIEAKQWSGSLSIADGTLRQNGYSRTKSIQGIHDATDAIAELVPGLPRTYFTSVLCFTGDAGIDGKVARTRLCTVDSLLGLLVRHPPVLSAEWQQFLGFELDMSTRTAAEPPGPRLRLLPNVHPSGARAPRRIRLLRTVRRLVRRRR